MRGSSFLSPLCAVAHWGQSRWFTCKIDMFDVCLCLVSIFFPLSNTIPLAVTKEGPRAAGSPPCCIFWRPFAACAALGLPPCHQGWWEILVCAECRNHPWGLKTALEKGHGLMPCVKSRCKWCAWERLPAFLPWNPHLEWAQTFHPGSSRLLPLPPAARGCLHRANPGCREVSQPLNLH